MKITKFLILGLFCMVFHNYAYSSDGSMLNVKTPPYSCKVANAVQNEKECTDNASSTYFYQDVVIVGGTPVEVVTQGNNTKLTCKRTSGTCCWVYASQTVWNIEEAPSLVVEDENGNILFSGYVDSYEVNEE